MRSVLLALAIALAAAQAVATDPPAREEVRRAAQEVRSHPDLGGPQKERTLRFKSSDKPRQSGDTSGLRWLAELLRWISETSRLLVWVGGAVLVALVLVGLWRWRREHADWAGRTGEALPSHVQNLDIRPESLPADIGAHAARLWQAGESRTALSLLYRGALSRLVHGHAVPIRAASTEGECLALVRSRLDAPKVMFFTRLVLAWQQSVYGGRLVGAEEALALCSEFDVLLAKGAAG
nr:DUF4129 domain-containing protein [Ramlibacter albus]